MASAMARMSRAVLLNRYRDSGTRAIGGGERSRSRVRLRPAGPSRRARRPGRSGRWRRWCSTASWSAGSGCGDEVVPASEPDQHVNAQRHERLQPVGHRRDLDRAAVPGSAGRRVRRRPAARSADCPRTSPSTRRSADRVRGRASRSSAVPRVRRTGGRPAPQPDSPTTETAVVAAQHVDVAGHVLQVAGVGHQSAQEVGRGQRVLRGAPTSPSRAGRGAARRDARDRPPWRAPSSRMRLASRHPRTRRGLAGAVSHNAQAVTLTNASAASAATSRSSG